MKKYLEWINIWIGEWRNEWIGEWMNEWISGMTRTSEYADESRVH